MPFLPLIRMALRSLVGNKLRTVLAMLGIVIGVMAVIAMLAIGTGARQFVLDKITSLGTNVLVVRPGQRGDRGAMTGTQQNLKLPDAVALMDVGGVHRVSPIVSGGVQAKYYDKNTSVGMLGVAITYFPMRNYELDHGAWFDDAAVAAHARVAVIGPTTAQHLMGDADPVGQTIKVNGVNFRVVAELKAKGDQGFFNPDDQILVPFTTAAKQVLGLDHLNEIDVETYEGADQAKVEQDVAAVMRKRHRIVLGAKDDVHVDNEAQFIKTFSTVTESFTVLLGGIAGISLLVGGIGIMNIMLVTVTERTREIGVRKAIGAKERDILRQFLIESILLSGLGGLLGVLAGVGLAGAVAAFSSFKPIVQPLGVIVALGFSAGVGVFFGLYPAYRASRLDPIEALRYE